jgi:hypothetical protein
VAGVESMVHPSGASGDIKCIRDLRHDVTFDRAGPRLEYAGGPCVSGEGKFPVIWTPPLLPLTCSRLHRRLWFLGFSNLDISISYPNPRKELET